MKYFSIDELCFSATAKKNGWENTPSEKSRQNLCILVDNLLDPLRELIGYPILVSSGYRRYLLNQTVGGSKNSQHMYGQAADILVPGLPPKYLYKMITEHFEFDQCILYKDFVHVSYKSGGNRNQSIIRMRK